MNTVRYIVGNALFAALVYYAVVEQVPYLNYAVYATVWLLAITSPLLCLKPVIVASMNVKSAMPHVVDVMYDVAIMSLLFMYGWNVIAFAYLVHTACLSYRHQQVTQLRALTAE